MVLSWPSIWSIFWGLWNLLVLQIYVENLSKHHLYKNRQDGLEKRSLWKFFKKLRRNTFSLSEQKPHYVYGICVGIASFCSKSSHDEKYQDLWRLTDWLSKIDWLIFKNYMSFSSTLNTFYSATVFKQVNVGWEVHYQLFVKLIQWYKDTRITIYRFK